VDSRRTVWQKYWAIDLVAIVMLVVVVIFAAVMSERASQARQLAHTLAVQAERQRQAICDMLASTPSNVPPNIARDRDIFARPSHPDECRPRPGVVPKPQPVHVTINGHPATIIVNPPAQPAPQVKQVKPSPRPQPRPTRSPTPRPTPRPTPTPSPSPTCLILGHICH
jgi:outer membrane biosynthesis protein TonB